MRKIFGAANKLGVNVARPLALVRRGVQRAGCRADGGERSEPKR